MQNDFVEGVRKFHEVYELPILNKPTFVRSRRNLRLDLIEEEFMELVQASNSEDLIGIADALGDLIYVVIGMALEFGIPIEEVFNEIQRSNMSKLDENGKVIKREDGKVLKGPNYHPPDIASILMRKRAIDQ